MNRSSLSCHPRIWMMGLLGLILIVGQGCSGFSTQDKPSWIDGESKKFPLDEFLIGRGQADRRPAATERAYGAVARIFQTQVTAQAMDHEFYRLTEGSGSTREERQLTLDHVTQVSTDKILEQVQVLDTWFDAQQKLHHTLAGLNRTQAETALLERMEDLDQQIQDERSASQNTKNPLATIRNMKRAITIFTQREALNADLRVIRTNGRGHPSPYRLGELTGQLDSYVANNLIITVEVTGTPAMETRQSLIEGLLQEGLPVLQDSKSLNDLQRSPSDEQPLHLGMKGFVTTWATSVGDPEFQFVKWCVDVVMVDQSNGQMVGAVSRRGREGQLTLQAAKQKSIRVMQNMVTQNVARTLAKYVYGETEAPKETSPPATCPRNNQSS